MKIKEEVLVGLIHLYYPTYYKTVYDELEKCFNNVSFKMIIVKFVQHIMHYKYDIFCDAYFHAGVYFIDIIKTWNKRVKIEYDELIENLEKDLECKYIYWSL